jgi:RNA polymerase sigma factor (sigma-70 family)
MADLRAFISTERQRLVRYVRSLLRDVTTLDAEDIVHEVLVRLLERSDTVAPIDSLAAYVYRSLRNRVIDSRRTQHPMQSLDDAGHNPALSVEDASPNALELLQTLQSRRTLFEALDALKSIERDVIVANEFEGIPFNELSRRWNVPLNTLLSHKSRGIRKLKQHFSQARIKEMHDA